MSGAFPTRTALGRQPYWDWRAASNFMLGGSGAGVLVYAAVCGERLLGLLGAALVGGGLLCVWFEIGKPWRALNAYRHSATSWMSREATVAPLLIASAVGAAWLDSPGLRWLAAALALAYVYCQARMLNAGRGIPAWRNPRSVPLLVASGLAEGAGLGVLAGGFWGPMAPPVWPMVLLTAMLSARVLAFWSYRRALPKMAAPGRALRELWRFGRWSGAVDVLAIAAAILAMVDARIAPLVPASALIAAGSGWVLKYSLVIRWSYEQPYAVPVTVARGGEFTPGTRSGGRAVSR